MNRMSVQPIYKLELFNCFGIFEEVNSLTLNVETCTELMSI